MTETHWIMLAPGGTPHALARNAKVTLCGRRFSGPVADALVLTNRCKRCAKRDEAAEASRRRWEVNQERAEVQATENRKGRFVIYRCKLCGAQHHPARQGVNWCMGAMHPAELEPVEVQGPTFESTVVRRGVAA